MKSLVCSSTIKVEMKVTNFRTINCLAVLYFSLFFASTMLSCTSNQLKVIDEPIAVEKFGFLQDGKTKKQEIIDRLGTFYSSFENGRIIIYFHLGEKGIRYNVVLVFGKNNVLKRHSFVQKSTSM